MFTHQLLCGAAYSSLLYDQRRRLHAQIADYIAGILSTQGTTTSPSHNAGRTVSTSTHLLAHHYWLALCDADGQLVDNPDQRLLSCAAEYLLRAGHSSISVGAVDNGALFLARAVRCLRCMADVERKEQLELQWLEAVVCTHLSVANGR